MKRNLFIVIVAAVMWACSQTDEPQMPTQSIKDEQTALTGTRTPEEAKACAIEAFTSFYGMSRALPIVKDVNVYGTDGLGRSTDSDTTFYVVNLEDNGGYAVIAADRQEQPVLAVTEAGNIEDIDSIENPGARMFFKAMVTPGHNFQPIDSTTIIRPIYDINYEYKTTSSVSEKIVGPHADFAWGQLYPEGMYFSNGYAGCGNVACVLSLSYFEEPKVFMSKDFDAVKVDWNLIKQHKKSFTSPFDTDVCGDMNALPHKALAELCYEIGRLNKSDLKEGGTNTYIEDVRQTIINICSNIKVYEICKKMPQASTILGDGMIYVRANEYGASVGHAFVIDGFKTETTTIATWRRPKNGIYWDLVDTYSSITGNYNHINWGWNGLDNGYYKVDVFNPAGSNYTDGFKYFVMGKK